MVRLLREVLAEFIGTLLLGVVVVGAGIAGGRLTGSVPAVALLVSAAVSAAGIYFLINLFAPVSGAHFNPLVSFADVALGHNSWRRAFAYLPAQVAGCSSGALLANFLFGLPIFEISRQSRASGPHFFSEVLATAVLLVVVFGLLRNGNHSRIAATVSAYIFATIWFSSSTCFANPAIDIARMLSNSPTGIAPSSVPSFVAAQIIGAVMAIGAVRYFFPLDDPDITK